MLIITLRTAEPEAKLGLFENDKKVGELQWLAHRELSTTLHLKLKELLVGHNKNLEDVQGLVVYKGPGSFTGLRIGLSVANALAYGLNIPIVGVTGSSWKENGIAELRTEKNQKSIMPMYGMAPHITKPRK